MIPKVIHFFHDSNFFNKKPSTQSETDLCIATWKHYLPDYELCLWHDKLPEFQTMLKTSRYMRACYEKKIWAAVADYVRAWVVYQYGGIYLDTDVYLLQNLDSLLNNQAFTLAVRLPGTDVHHVEPAVLGAVAHHSFLKEVLDIYQGDELFKSPMWMANQVFSVGIQRAQQKAQGAVTQPPATCPDLYYSELQKQEPVHLTESGITIYPQCMFEQGGRVCRIKGRWMIVGGFYTRSQDVFNFKKVMLYHLCQNSWTKSRYFLETKHLTGLAKWGKIIHLWLKTPWLGLIKGKIKRTILRFVK